ncbi:HAD family hydrolase [uncultured Dubosiella sp.]|uniref:HAD family hydrolase n=1 Tax=uncultured Dubosiella sp. TaxID=1937011 RepID=UPI0025AEE9D9|nr:HAD family hydrolase [uncultured Dubosiella sp.]
MIKTILFDLDGTLLPMDQEQFVELYFQKLAAKMAYAFDSRQLIRSIWAATEAMIKDQGPERNERVFWKKMEEMYGESILEYVPVFERFYEQEFQEIQKVCLANPESQKIVEALKKKYRLMLATNPLFPQIATYSRIRWAGLDPNDFDLVTTYENASACKPSLAYYENILRDFDLKPEECVMVGNDVDEDMVARKLGMRTFLLTDHLINRSNQNIDLFAHGDFQTLLAYLKTFEED